MRFDSSAYEALDRACVSISRALATSALVSSEELSRLLTEHAKTLSNAKEGALARSPEAASRAPRVGGVLAEIVRSGRTLHVERVFGVPLRFGELVVGGLCVADRHDGADFDDRDKLLVEAFAERAAISIEIAQRRAEAHAQAAARDEMLAAVSHELRSPLQAIQLCTSLLAKRALPDERRRGRRQIEVISRATDRMKRLIDDLLEATMIDAGTFDVVTGPEQVLPMVEQAIDAADASAARKAMKVEHRVDGALAPVRCDRERVMQVLANLIDNAIKFSPTGGSVFVHAAREGDAVRFAVADTGPGIPDAELGRLFDRYWTAKKRSPHGAGLGLFISKAIIEALGGRLWVESKSGTGTTFFFTLPVMQTRP
jgi:signal transduction histidine kinase